MYACQVEGPTFRPSLSPDCHPLSQLMTASTSPVPALASADTASQDTYPSTKSTKFGPLRLELDPTGTVIIAQSDYECGQPFPTNALSQPCAYDGFSLSSAMANKFDALSGAHEVAFPGVTFGQKISVRLRVCHPLLHA